MTTCEQSWLTNHAFWESNLIGSMQHKECWNRTQVYSSVALSLVLRLDCVHKLTLAQHNTT